MIALAVFAFFFWVFPLICLALTCYCPKLDKWNPAAQSDDHALFDRESMRQMGRLDLNEEREKQGLPPIPEPRGLHPQSEYALLLKRKGLWPEAPDGRGGVWFNHPHTRYRGYDTKRDVVGIVYTWQGPPKKYIPTKM